MTKHTDERENEHISVEQVIELACELSNKELFIYWSAHYPSMQIDQLDENGKSTGVYTDLAQDKFNLIYDDIEGQIIDLMKKYPDKNIQEIEECIDAI